MTHGIPLERTKWLHKDQYNVNESTFLGAKCTNYKRKDGGDSHSFLDNMFENYRPYVLGVTAAVHSPMKLFVYNQNRSAIIFGNNGPDAVKNIVRFEVSLRLLDLHSILPIPNKPRLIDHVKIADFNNVLNENKF